MVLAAASRGGHGGREASMLGREKAQTTTIDDERAAGHGSVHAIQDPRAHQAIPR
jgi:hypothetical protein